MAPFYARIDPDPALARGYVALLDAIDVYTARGRPDLAARIRLALRRMWAEYERLGIEAATEADRAIVDRIRQTAVRPPTSGRLAQAIRSHPLPSTFPAGAVGIADLATLDKGAVNPRAAQAGEYWRAQEYGTAAHVGRIVPGYFQPGGARPSASEFRVHPYFEQASGRGTPAMRITRPLQARHFLRDGTDAAAVWHRGKSAAINRRAISVLASL